MDKLFGLQHRRGRTTSSFVRQTLYDPVGDDMFFGGAFRGKTRG